uniref:Uncharacterized protein n=1 Tax=Heterorhabditis bacteriophora TaxID=37862 RepID=A0A1I7WCF4_HETBA
MEISDELNPYTRLNNSLATTYCCAKSFVGNLLT